MIPMNREEYERWLSTIEDRFADDSWEDGISRVTKTKDNSVQRLKCLGNGQVPLSAAVAWKILKE